MARSKGLPNVEHNYGGRIFSPLELIDALYLSGKTIDEISEVVNMDQLAFRNKYTKRLEELDTVHRGMILQAGMKAATSEKSFSNKILELFLYKYNFLVPETSLENVPKPWTVVLANNANVDSQDKNITVEEVKTKPKTKPKPKPKSKPKPKTKRKSPQVKKIARNETQEKPDSKKKRIQKTRSIKKTKTKKQV